MHQGDSAFLPLLCLSIDIIPDSNYVEYADKTKIAVMIELEGIANEGPLKNHGVDTKPFEVPEVYLDIIMVIDNS